MAKVARSKIARRDELSAAEDLLTSRVSYGDVVVELRDRFGISERTAKRRIAEVYERWAVEAEATRDAQRETQERSLLRLYRAAFADRRYEVCVRIEQLLAKFYGSETRVATALSSSIDELALAEFESRRPDELEFYAAFGFWKEEAPRNFNRESFLMSKLKAFGTLREKNEGN